MPRGEPGQHLGSVGRSGDAGEFQPVIQARNWLDGQLSGDTRVALPWESLLAFLRIVTNPRVFDRPQSIATAWKHVEDWLECESVWTPAAGSAHRSILAGLLGA